MGVGDFQVTGALPKVGTQGGGTGLPKMPSMNRPGFLSNMGAGVGGGVGNAVQPMQGQGLQQGGMAPNGAYSGGAVVAGQQNVGAGVSPSPFVSSILQAHRAASTPATRPDWGDSPGGRVQPTTNAPPRDWYDSVGAQTNEQVQSRQGSGLMDALMQQLRGNEAAYGMGSRFANQNYGLDQRSLGLRKQLNGIQGADIGIDKQANRNQYGGVQQDSQFLQQQRGLYGDQLANQLAQIDTKLGVDKLDHENHYAAGGSWFTPGQKFRSDAMLTGAEQSRTDARLGTQMSQLGVDRSLAGNDVQLRGLDLDMGKLDNKLKANGIDMQQLGINGEQLAVGLQQQLEKLGLDRVMGAEEILNAALSGGTEQSDYALKMLMEFFQNGGVGQMPSPMMNGGLG